MINDDIYILVFYLGGLIIPQFLINITGKKNSPVFLKKRLTDQVILLSQASFIPGLHA
jgi:hypothetical protein